MMQNVILHTTTTNELLDQFRGIVKDELANLEAVKKQQDIKPKLYSRKEVGEILGISLPTLHEWTKEGVIKAHRIGSRIRYRHEDVDNALKEIGTLKFSRRK